MIRKLWLSLLVMVVLVSGTYTNAAAAPIDLYVAPTGNDANPCTSAAPCKTIQKAVNSVQPGGTVYILAGTYTEQVTVSKIATQTQPIRIIGQQAVLSNGGQLAFSVSNSQWLTFEGLSINGYTLSNVELRQSRFITFRNNKMQYTTAGITIKDGSSHILVENNEFYQTYPAGSTWTSLKGSKYEGGGIYASSGGQGMYFIRGNNFHDSMNGVYITDDDPGQWMNANVFISGNTFRNIVDDPFEPEGDSFNIHFYNNTLINTHRIASLTPGSTCLGPVFVYGNYQQNNTDPTGEALSGRLNSAVKADMGSGSCPNGIWVFNNTVSANAAGTNFYGVDLLSSTLKNFQMLNNVFVTEKNVFTGKPAFNNALSAYNVSLKPFGYTEPNSLQADPLLAANGTLQNASPAKGRGAAVNIMNYFATSALVPAGADPGAFRTFPAPIYVTPPSGAPSGFPTNATGWPNSQTAPAPTSTAAPITATASPALTTTPSPAVTPTSTAQSATSTPASATQAATQPVQATGTQVTITQPATNTPAPTLTATPLPTLTLTPVSPTFTATSAPTLPPPTATQIPPTFTPTAEPTANVAGMTVYNDTHPALVFSKDWQDVQRDRAYEKSFKTTAVPGSSVTLQFTGQALGLLYTTGKNFGKVEIYIDNQLVGVLDQQTRQNKFQQRWDYQGTLSLTPHELKLVFIGSNQKGSLDAILIR